MRLALICLTLAAFAAPAAARSDAAPAPVDMTVESGGATLHGTLLAPAPAPGMEPVLILAGSGPTDRDGNNPLGVRASSYRLLAEALAGHGIATLRVDKRGIGASAAAMASEADLRLSHYASDARAWAAALRERIDARCVWLLGHSEGTLHALLAAGEAEGICGLILVSPVGRRADLVLTDQLRANPANAPILDEALRIVAELRAGRTVPAGSVSPVLAPLFRPSVQPFLIDMFAADPAVLARRYPGPILIVQGTTDIQTPESDARSLASARPGIALHLVEGMNHILKTAPADRAANLATYADPDLPLAPGLVDPIVEFIRAN